MKKILCILMACLMLLGLCACGDDSKTSPSDTPAPAPTAAEPATEPAPTEPEATPLSIGDTLVAPAFTMTFDSLEVLDEFSYKTSEYSSTSLYVEDGYKLLLLTGHIENTGTTAFSDSSFFRTCVVNDSYTVTDYDVRLSFKRDKYFEVDAYTDVDYYLYINIPEKLAAQYEKATFTLGFNDDMSLLTTYYNIDGTKSTPVDNLYTISGGTAAAAPETPAPEAPAPQEQASEAPAGNTLSLGDTISTEDFDFTLNNVELTYELKPQNTSSVYTSYTAPDGKVYIHVDGSFYNKSKRDYCIRDLFIPEADYDNGYTYKGFAVTDKDDNSFTWASSYVVCTPLETCHYHGLVECPKVVDGSDAPLIVTLNIGGQVYTYTIR